MNTHTNSPDILLHEVVSHGHNYRINLCLCLYLLTRSYLVADAIAYLLSPQCLNVAPSISTHQCQVDTAPSWINMLVPGFQEPPTADLLSELISIHEINVLFDANVWFDTTNGIPGWALIHLSWLTRVLWRGWHLLRCSVESGKPVVDFKSNSCQEGWRNAWSLPSTVGRGTECPKLGNILTRDWITYLLVSFFYEQLCSCMCVYLNSARVTAVFWHQKLKC